MKILCVCNHGNVRSAGMARELKDKGHEAIAIGICPDLTSIGNPWKGFSEETFNMMCNWADLIIDLSDIDSKSMNEDPGMYIRLKLFVNKTMRFYIGGDKWGNPFHPDLRTRLQLIIKELNL